jgi:hypothetical protein
MKIIDRIRGKTYWTDVFSFSKQKWYTAKSTDNEMVDLIMKSIIFFFLNGIIHYFFEFF